MSGDTVEEPAAATPRRPSRLAQAARIAWVVAVVVALVVVVVREGPDLAAAVGRVGVARVGASTVAGLLAVLASVALWRPLLSGLGGTVPLRPAVRVLTVSQLGKYLPGAVWPALVQVDLTRAHGVRPAAAVGGFALFAWYHLVTGAVVAVPLLVGADVVGWWALVAVPAGLAACAPPLLDAVGRLAVRILRRNPLPSLPWRSAILAVVASVPMWAAYTVHVWLLAEPLGGGLGVSGGAFAAAYVVGFLVVVAPAGAGAREAVAATVLVAGGMTTADALAVALASRVLLVVADALAAGIGVVVGRTSRR